MVGVCMLWHDAQVRRRALEVMEAVLRGGVMPPFTSVATLFALTTDPTR